MGEGLLGRGTEQRLLRRMGGAEVDAERQPSLVAGDDLLGRRAVADAVVAARLVEAGGDDVGGAAPAPVETAGTDTAEVRHLQLGPVGNVPPVPDRERRCR